MHRRLRTGLEALGLELRSEAFAAHAELHPYSRRARTTRRCAGRLLEEYGIEIGAGLGVMAGKAWRIGLMGHGATVRNVDLVLAALRECLLVNIGMTAVCAQRRLAALLPQDRLPASPSQLGAYESDGLTAFRARPLAVAMPETADEVIALVRFCHAERLPFVARGSGTSLSGGSLPVAGGIVIALNRLNRILRLDPAQRIAVVEPGVVNTQVTRGGRAARTALRARSFQPIHLHDRRKCRFQFRRRALPEIRHDLEPCARHQSGARHRRSRGMGRRRAGNRSGRIGAGFSPGNEGLFGIALEITLQLLPRAEMFSHRARRLSHARTGRRCRLRRRRQRLAARRHRDHGRARA